MTEKGGFQTFRISDDDARRRNELMELGLFESESDVWRQALESFHPGLLKLLELDPSIANDTDKTPFRVADLTESESKVMLDALAEHYGPRKIQLMCERARKHRKVIEIDEGYFRKAKELLEANDQGPYEYDVIVRHIRLASDNGNGKIGLPKAGDIAKRQLASKRLILSKPGRYSFNVSQM